VRHDLRIDGQAFRLRPVGLDDAAFILELRVDPRAAGRLHPVSGRIEDQVAWLEQYFDRPGDWYWIVERVRDDAPEGALGLYDLDAAKGRAEWGRWILRPGSLAAPESALLLYRLAFDRLGLTEVRCRTVATNARVVSFHDRSGLEHVGVLPAAVQFRETTVDAVEHRLRRENWPATRDLLELSAAQAAELLSRVAGP
jgi:RimJ/RimL family protein N-acetyltransferase